MDLVMIKLNKYVNDDNLKKVETKLLYQEKLQTKEKLETLDKVLNIFSLLVTNIDKVVDDWQLTSIFLSSLNYIKLLINTKNLEAINLPFKLEIFISILRPCKQHLIVQSLSSIFSAAIKNLTVETLTEVLDRVSSETFQTSTQVHNILNLSLFILTDKPAKDHKETILQFSKTVLKKSLCRNWDEQNIFCSQLNVLKNISDQNSSLFSDDFISSFLFPKFELILNQTKTRWLYLSSLKSCIPSMIESIHRENLSSLFIECLYQHLNKVCSLIVEKPKSACFIGRFQSFEHPDQLIKQELHHLLICNLRATLICCKSSSCDFQKDILEKSKVNCMQLLQCEKFKDENPEDLLISLVIEEDDVLVEVLLLHLLITQYSRKNQIHFYLSQNVLFLEFIHHLQFDSSLILDLMLSNETDTLSYVLRFVKESLIYPSELKAACLSYESKYNKQNAFFQLKNLVHRLKTSVETLHTNNLVPFNPQPLIRNFDRFVNSL